MADKPFQSSANLISTLFKKGGQAKDATDACFKVFTELKSVLIEFERDTLEHIKEDKRLKVKYTDRGVFEAEIKVADDVNIFIMHTNAFVFDATHPLWKTSYFSLDESHGTCGMISIYNFLSDSFKFDRTHDVGHLVGRIFINKDEHFYVEGKKQLGLLFNDFAGQLTTPEKLREIVEASVIYSLDIDISVPPYEAMKEITVNEVLNYNMQTAVNAGKRLGFKFQNEGPDVEA